MTTGHATHSVSTCVCVCRWFAEDLPNATVQGYELVGDGPLGSGGFGVVHCCRCQLDRRLVAVKTVYQPFVENEVPRCPGGRRRLLVTWEHL